MTFVFRNATLEPFAGTLFPGENVVFSGYGDVSEIPENAAAFCWFYTFPFDCGNAALAGTLDGFAAGLQLALKSVPENKIFTAFEMNAPAGFALAAENDFAETQIRRYNATLAALAETHPNLKIQAFPKNFPKTNWRLWFVAQTPPAAEGNKPVPAIRKKCAVLDLDGTLWDGTLDEDGGNGIRADGDYPGNAFRFFQTRLKELADAGILLAISSKNDLSAVKNVFENKKMPLSLSDFSAVRCDWRDKATHIREIAETLNIGPDALVFIDNSPAERAWVKTAFPQTAVPEFPEKPYALPEFYASLLDRFFRAEKLLAEDFDKTRQYAQNAARERFAASCTDYDAYLKSLNIKLEIAVNDKTTFPRLAQISQKTNQFNLCTRRLTETALNELLSRGAQIFALSVSDIFGDSGIVGLAVALPAGTDFEIVELALSCRVLGRKIENLFLERIVEILRSRENVRTLRAHFFPTAKNTKYADFYQKNGFEKSDGVFRKSLLSRQD